MPKKIWVFMLTFVFLLSLMLPNAPTAQAKGKSKGNQEKIAKKWVKKKLKSMSVEEKVGQLFIIHAYGKTPTDPDYTETNLNSKRGGANYKEIIEKFHIGGVIYFNWNDNIGTPINPKQVQALSNGLQKIALKQKSKIPLFISTDQEGGIVARVTEPATVLPGNMALGATKSVTYAKKSAEIIGTELKSLGINMDFAPDLDVNVNPENPVIGVRSYSENPNLVGTLGTAQIEGLQKQNVIATGKHFPGHGDTNVDSHYGLPIVNHDLKTLYEVDLNPFRTAIKSGVDAIMTAHIVVPALDSSGLPATLSKPIMTGVLRNQLKYDGLIITDSLDMSGANVLPADQVPVAAFEAGADILLNPPDVELAYKSILKAVKTKKISKKRLDQSVTRILLAKYKRGIIKQPLTKEKMLKKIGTPENLKMADEITEKSITLIKNDHHTLPLKRNQKVLITGPTTANSERLGTLLTDKGLDAIAYGTNTSPTAAEIQTAVDKAKNTEVIVVATYNANTNTAQQTMVKALKQTGKPVVIASMRNPYDIMSFPEVDANILTYGNRDISTRALAKALVGEISPSGKLPVTIPGLYSFGTGLHY
ncbi:glycoside hydrolase family 3 protein [Heyndrickxia sporothermodurans]|uniref:beta-N-acetylhexosaminidase n=1 Tax=Heyndrickxia sporothermodurans TaxID=46224 RepID=A0A150KJV8_9BACI|nr:glycoside hydrolase family 3 protein [Heyndrickxia sporothermodurans]KYC84205.1 Beta-hexosaminidase [Heyndrickxia sporothermodurans]